MWHELKEKLPIDVSTCYIIIRRRRRGRGRNNDQLNATQNLLTSSDVVLKYGEICVNICSFLYKYLFWLVFADIILGTLFPK